MRILLLTLFLAWGCPVFADIAPGMPAPSFKAPLLDGGGELDSATHRGKVVYIDFWASWCAPCRQAMPTYDRLARMYAPMGLVIIGVNQDANSKDAHRFLSRTRVSFPLVADSGHAIARAFDFKTMPTGYLIDRKGRVRYVHSGFQESSVPALEATIMALLKEGA
jgi:peroxiredoxin